MSNLPIWILACACTSIQQSLNTKLVGSFVLCGEPQMTQWTTDHYGYRIKELEQSYCANQTKQTREKIKPIEKDLTLVGLSWM